MQVKQLSAYKQPSLPTRAVIDDHPELLKLLPKRWQRNPAVLTALAGVCVLTSGCGDKQPKQGHLRVAPVFVHGDGVGAFGCIAVNPPVVLSEEDAGKVIAEECKRAGIAFTSGGPKLTAIKMPGWVGPHGGRQRRGMLPVRLDGTDSRRRIAFEFVSTKDAEDWQRPPRTTSDVIETAEQARRLRSKLLKTSSAGKTYAVFYDPLAKSTHGGLFDVSTSKCESIVSVRNRGRQQLRAQVRDFIKWLKAEGVI